jgi:hypothetical protein
LCGFYSASHGRFDFDDDADADTYTDSDVDTGAFMVIDGV